MPMRNTLLPKRTVCEEAGAECKDFQPCCPRPRVKDDVNECFLLPISYTGSLRWSNWVWMSESHVVVFELENRCCPYIALPTRSEPITYLEVPAE